MKKKIIKPLIEIHLCNGMCSARFLCKNNNKKCCNPMPKDEYAKFIKCQFLKIEQ